MGGMRLLVAHRVFIHIAHRVFILIAHRVFIHILGMSQEEEDQNEGDVAVEWHIVS